jgi:hypothetical protein
MAKVETEDVVTNKMIIDFFAFFCVSFFAYCHGNHHLVMNSQASVYEVVDIKRGDRQIDSPV